MPICFMLFMHEVCLAFALARARAGKSNDARIAMMAMTTSSSIRVKPATFFVPGRSPGPTSENNDFLRIMFLRSRGGGVPPRWDMVELSQLPRRLSWHMNWPLQRYPHFDFQWPVVW